MATVDIHSHEGLSLRRILIAPFAVVGNALIALAENNSRAHRAAELNAMTDAQLDARGLKREDIVRVVFADRIGL